MRLPGNNMCPIEIHCSISQKIPSYLGEFISRTENQMCLCGNLFSFLTCNHSTFILPCFSSTGFPNASFKMSIVSVACKNRNNFSPGAKS